MSGFRGWLEKAVRVEQQQQQDAATIDGVIDWSVHTVDYKRFKQRLKFFARRRAQIRNMIRASPDGTLSEQVLTDLLGPKSKFPAKKIGSGGDSSHDCSGTGGGGGGGGDSVVPLSQTLSVDPHAHVGMGGPPGVVSVPSPDPKPTSAAAAAAAVEESGGGLYVAMADNTNNKDNNHQDDGIINTMDSALSFEETYSQSSGEGNGDQRRRNQASVMRRLSISERNEIIHFLEWEMDKALMLYLAQCQKLTQRLHQQQQQHYQRHATAQPPQANDTDANFDYSTLEDRGDGTGRAATAAVVQFDAASAASSAASVEIPLDTTLGDEILELVAFCVINVVAAQQILVRYDAFVRAFEGTPMLNFYMKKVTKHATSFRAILSQDQVGALATDFVALARGSGGSAAPGPTSPSQSSSPYLVHFQAQRDMFEDIVSSLQSTEALQMREHVVPVSDACMYGIRKWLMVGLFEDRLGLEPAYLMARGQSLTSEMERLAVWRKKKKHDVSLAFARKSPKNNKELSGMQVFHLTLNLLAAFLYCMNYYIVEPSSTMYVNRLGAFDAMSGTLIGMMPLAAFVSSIPYSMWTNSGFRHPFLMSAGMMFLGNMLYSLADQFGVVWVALLGRFIAGLGAPKCIIRRYMADTTPVSLRTGVNAGFGMVVAAGSAMGPAMAIVLNKFEYTLYVRPVGLVTLNGLTLPGYFMACLWFTFGVIVLATFEEPDREGLKEQKEMEAKGIIPYSPSSVSSMNGAVNDENMTIFSGESAGVTDNLPDWEETSTLPKWMIRIVKFSELITLPVRLCLFLLFCKVFTIESLVSATSSLSKNRYKWQVQQVGTLGLTCGLLVIPFSILVGRLSMSYQDHVLMKWLVSAGCFGMFLLIDLSDLAATPSNYYNEGHPLAVSPTRYIIGYFMSYLCIQSFEGVIGSTLSKVIPTALASGTFNSGLLATLVDTFGRTCGDLFISAAGFINLRQLINLLFIPGFAILFTCLVIIQRCRDMLSV